MTKIII